MPCTSFVMSERSHDLPPEFLFILLTLLAIQKYNYYKCICLLSLNFCCSSVFLAYLVLDI